MYKYISFFIIISIFLYPINVVLSLQSSNVVLWQSVLNSILNLKQIDSSFAGNIIKDMNGDTIIDVRDLCIIAQKMHNKKTEIPISENKKNLELFNSPIRTDKILFTFKILSNWNNARVTNFGQSNEEYIVKCNTQVLKWVKLNIKTSILPLLC